MKLQRQTRETIITTVLFALLLVVLFIFIGRIEKKTNDNRLQTVKEAVRCAAITCYAVEGRYPENVNYLMSNYGLVYDEHRYLICYEAFADNVLPDISVIVKGAPK